MTDVSSLQDHGYHVKRAKRILVQDTRAPLMSGCKEQWKPVTGTSDRPREPAVMNCLLLSKAMLRTIIGRILAFPSGNCFKPSTPERTAPRAFHVPWQGNSSKDNPRILWHRTMLSRSPRVALTHQAGLTAAAHHFRNMQSRHG